MATRGATQTSVVAEERNGVGWREARNSEHGADGCVLGGSESIALELVRLGSDPSFDTGHMDVSGLGAGNAVRAWRLERRVRWLLALARRPRSYWRWLMRRLGLHGQRIGPGARGLVAQLLWPGTG